MPDQPIKLFASRAERYPEQDGADIAQGSARALLAAIPVIGGPITEVLAMVLTPALARRRDKWFKELADALDQLEERTEGFRVEELENNEPFISAVIQASRTAIATHQSDKRAMLRNALLNIAAGNAPAGDLESVFLTFVDTFTSTHIQILSLFHSGDRGNRLRFKEWRDLSDQVICDLRDRGLLRDTRPLAARDRESSEALVVYDWEATGFGRQFLRFISSPLSTS